jgi:hypothetical protein
MKIITVKIKQTINGLLYTALQGEEQQWNKDITFTSAYQSVVVGVAVTSHLW